MGLFAQAELDRLWEAVRLLQDETEPDGTCAYMVENQYHVPHGADWLPYARFPFRLHDRILWQGSAESELPPLNGRVIRVIPQNKQVDCLLDQHYAIQVSADCLLDQQRRYNPRWDAHIKEETASSPLNRRSKNRQIPPESDPKQPLWRKTARAEEKPIQLGLFAE